MKAQQGNKEFEEFYSVFPWPNDPESAEGK